MLAVDVVDTAALPESDRFGFWHDLVARESVPARIHSAHSRDFRAGATVVSLGDVVVSRWRYPSLEMHRTARQIRRGDPEMYQLALPLSGRGWMEQERRETILAPGHLNFVDTSRPHASMHEGAESEPDRLLTTLTVLVPHSMIPVHPNKIAKLLGASIPTTEGMGVLLTDFVQQVVGHPEQYEVEDAPRLGFIARDLIAATVAHRLDVASSLPQDFRGHAQRLRIVAFIQSNLHDRNLTPAAVAAAHHLSLRTMYRLFEAEPASVAELIRRGRLDRCATDLRDPRLRDRPIYAIAARWGFTDKAYFSRAFRTVYGQSPRGYRGN
ncbi:helix-turn-helix domain-containing protein [Micromonospora sp. NPDC005710]|uniref:AraC-like ligand-binding domain-containing protein n=1 Tax=Micromonospora sp. NPDC005710 TaxID=3157051 RepID=UPI0033D55E11